MVKNRVLPPPPTSQNPTDAERKIPGGPCHDISDVKKLARSSARIKLVTQDCSSDVAKLGMDTEDVSDVFSNISSAHYHDSEWCRTSSKSPWFPCDSYTIWYTMGASRTSSLRLRLYMKFFIAGSGDLVMFVSFHESSSN